MRPILAPSILAADFSRLGAQIAQVRQGGAEYLHLDVMDGHFVPNITIGPAVVASISRGAGMVLDAHLMIEEPIRFIEAFALAGAGVITVHAEAREPGLAIKAIKGSGKKAGLAINPCTPANVVEPFLADGLDMVLVMSVEPGFGAQKLIPGTLRKAREIAGYIERHGLGARLEMDGGIYLTNVRDVLDAGVDVAVAGSAVFGGPDPGAAARAFMDVFEIYIRGR